jgi:ribose 5-phosphate isomerase B
MRVALGADHAGRQLKDQVRGWLEARGIDVTDFGTHSSASVDYPDFADAVARAVAGGAADRGILVCGSGIGMAIAANKVPGIRAAAVSDPHAAALSRAHNDANVLALGERLTPTDQARAVVEAFLDTAFDGGRHQQRIDKIATIEGARP